MPMQKIRRACSKCFMLRDYVENNHPFSVYTGLISWRKYLRKNCWQGRGADNVLPEPYSDSLSLTNCQGACEIDESCEGIVIKRGKESLGPCFMRRNIELSRCKDYEPYDLYLKPTGRQSKM